MFGKVAELSKPFLIGVATLPFKQLPAAADGPHAYTVALGEVPDAWLQPVQPWLWHKFRK